MVDTYFPVAWDPVGDNVAPSGHTLGSYMIPAEDQYLKGISFDSPAAQAVDLRAYAIGGTGGGDGNPMFTALGVNAVEGLNSFPFDDLLPVLAGRRYAFVVQLKDGGRFKSVYNGALSLTGAFTSVNEYWSVRVLDNDTLPATMTMAVSMADPWEQWYNYYGVGVYYSSLPSKVIGSKIRIDDDHISIDWVDPGDAPDGVSILRAPGSHRGDDTEGRPPSDPLYDPTSIEGCVEIASGLTDGPYIDTLPEPGTYTYWPVRTEAI